eukprot:scaffold345924_cov15-Prasinocladus_malaysianus.AAC.1
MIATNDAFVAGAVAELVILTNIHTNNKCLQSLHIRTILRVTLQSSVPLPQLKLTFDADYLWQYKVSSVSSPPTGFITPMGTSLKLAADQKGHFGASLAPSNTPRVTEFIVLFVTHQQTLFCLEFNTNYLRTTMKLSIEPFRVQDYVSNFGGYLDS